MLRGLDYFVAGVIEAFNIVLRIMRISMLVNHQKLNISLFNAHSIGSSLVTAVVLCVKRDVIKSLFD